MKNTLLITKFFPPEKGGIQSYLYNICQNLDRDKISIQTEKKDSPPDKEELKVVSTYNNRFSIYNYKIKNIHSLLNLTFLPILFKTLKIIKEKQIENLFLGHFYIPYTFTALYLKKFKNIPYTIFTHGLEILEAKNNSKSNSVLKSCLKNAQNIIVTTDYLKKKIEHQYPNLDLSSKIIKIPPGVDYNYFKPGLDISNLKNKLNLQDKKIIFTCGRLVKRKNHQLIIKALPEIIQKVPNTIYLIAGHGPEEKNLKQLVQKMSLETRVKFLGEVKDKDLPYYYNLADIFCTPSLYNKKSGDVEGFGIVFLEAQSTKTPTIGSNTGGIPEAIRHNIDGFLVDPQNSQELASYITKLLLNNDLIQEMGEAARKKVIQEHDWKKLVKKLPL